MAWDKTGEVIYGAGYYEALPNHYYYVPTLPGANAWRGGLGGLHVSRIEWDDNGNTTSITGLSPFFEGQKPLPITSDVKNPKLVDGILLLRFEGQGDTEYGFKIVFGKIASITPLRAGALTH